MKKSLYGKIANVCRQSLKVKFQSRFMYYHHSDWLLNFSEGNIKDHGDGKIIYAFRSWHLVGFKSVDNHINAH